LCGTFPVTLKEEQRFTTFWKRVLRKWDDSKRDNLAKRWEK
jgi:hypothetical protein